MPLLPRTWQLDIDLDNMQRFLDHIGASLEEEGASIREQYEKATKGLAGDELADYWDFFGEDLDELEKDFPRSLYSGFLSSWYSFVEVSLLRFCERRGLRIEETPLERVQHDKGIHRARRFLSVAAGYEIDNDHWQELLHINYARNVIVHELGRVPTVGAVPEGDTRNHEQIELIEGYPFFVRLNKSRFDYLMAFDLLRYQGPTFVLDPNLQFSEHLIGFARNLFHKLFADLYDDD